jgi:hypothetical protein
MNPTQTDSHLTTDRPTLTAKGDSSRCQHRYSNGQALPSFRLGIAAWSLFSPFPFERRRGFRSAIPK